MLWKLETLFAHTVGNKNSCTKYKISTIKPKKNDSVVTLLQGMIYLVCMNILSRTPLGLMNICSADPVRVGSGCLKRLFTDFQRGSYGTVSTSGVRLRVFHFFGATVDLMVLRIDPIAALRVLVDHFGPIRDTIKYRTGHRNKKDKKHSWA